MNSVELDIVIFKRGILQSYARHSWIIVII